MSGWDATATMFAAWLQQQENKKAREEKPKELPLTPQEQWLFDRQKEQYDYSPMRHYISGVADQYISNGPSMPQPVFVSDQYKNANPLAGFSMPKIDTSKFPKYWEKPLSQQGYGPAAGPALRPGESIQDGPEGAYGGAPGETYQSGARPEDVIPGYDGTDPYQRSRYMNYVGRGMSQETQDHLNGLERSTPESISFGGFGGLPTVNPTQIGRDPNFIGPKQPAWTRYQNWRKDRVWDDAVIGAVKGGVAGGLPGAAVGAVKGGMEGRRKRAESRKNGGKG